MQLRGSRELGVEAALQGLRQSNPAKVSAAAQREAAKTPGPAPGQHKTARGPWASSPPGDELSKIKKELAALRLQVKQARPATEPEDEPKEEPEEGAATKREKLQQEVDALRAVLGEQHPEVQTRRQQLEELQKQRPVGARLLAAQRRISKVEKKLEQKTKAVSDLEASIAESQKKLEDMRGEAKALQEELEQQKQEQAKLLEDEAKAKDDPKASKEPGWMQLSQWIGSLASKEGTPAGLASQLQSVCKAIEESKIAEQQKEEPPRPTEPEEQKDADMEQALDEDDIIEAVGVDPHLGTLLGAMDGAAKKRLAGSINAAMAAKARRVAADSPPKSQG